MPKRNKYRRGRRIRTMCELVKMLEQRKYVFWGMRPTHPSWVLSLQVNYVISQLRRGTFHYAIENGDFRDG